MATLFWFRNGLRVHDNRALLKALDYDLDEKTSCIRNADKKHSALVYPVYILEPDRLKSGLIGPNRVKYLQVKTCHCREAAVDKSAGDPLSKIPKLCADYKVNKLVFERDTDEYCRGRDENIKELMKKCHVQVETYSGHTLWDLDDIMDRSGGQLTKSYGPFVKLLEKMPQPQNRFPSIPTMQGTLDPHMATDPKYDLPNVEDYLQGKEPTTIHKGGESEGLRRLDNYLQDTTRTRVFRKPQTSPIDTHPASTTILSPFMKFGSLSCRTFWHRVNEVYKKGQHSAPPESLIGQLYWREFFYSQGEVALLIPWKGYNENKEDEEKFQAWAEGRTRYPWIDAVMHQLIKHGWMHQLARHCVACFLTRGQLFISWEKGAEVFHKYLLDADYNLNNGNWLWLSASAYYTTYFRVYSPTKFPQKYGKSDGAKFIRQFVPEVAKLPDLYIFEPWKAPPSVQKSSNCVLGKDYPHPIMDAENAKAENMEIMRICYEKKVHGNCSPKEYEDHMALFKIVLAKDYNQYGNGASNKAPRKGQINLETAMQQLAKRTQRQRENN
ncbi:hypothetical protein BZG36_05550 [Bifiguratus adelaidae]|uniref:Photolyase/cryptochrome alpha/beta domain-containing protein n=1 Tax=Bifiguratus adelaidae TaxID=1938954 RepID=A0A261XT22_9FUNG|nr:hypothetical protein BZG36_05550 [Bifiguratus adelaidae]